MPVLKVVVSDEQRAAIESVRGDVPASAWVRRLIERALTAEGAVVPEGAGRVVEVPVAPSRAEAFAKATRRDG